MKEYASGNLYLGDIYKPLTEVVMDAKCAKAIMMEIKECRDITSRELEILSYLGSSWKWSLIDAKHYFRDFCQGQHDVYGRLGEFVLQENLSPIYTAGMLQGYLDVIRSMGHDVESGSWDDNGCDRISYLEIDGVVLIKNSKLDIDGYVELLKK